MTITSGLADRRGIRWPPRGIGRGRRSQKLNFARSAAEYQAALTAWLAAAGPSRFLGLPPHFARTAVFFLDLPAPFVIYFSARAARIFMVVMSETHSKLFRALKESPGYFSCTAPTRGFRKWVNCTCCLLFRGCAGLHEFMDFLMDSRSPRDDLICPSRLFKCSYFLTDAGIFVNIYFSSDMRLVMVYAFRLYTKSARN